MWFVFFVGYVGICWEDGVIFDFVGNINVDNFVFGLCVKYVCFSFNNVWVWIFIYYEDVSC